MTEAERKNVPGQIYVAADCCFSCGIPIDAAPEMFTWDGDGPCFVYRQPQSAADFAKILDIMSRQEVDCIRYRGDNPAEIQQFADLNLLGLCDLPLAQKPDRS